MSILNASFTLLQVLRLSWSVPPAFLSLWFACGTFLHQGFSAQQDHNKNISMPRGPFARGPFLVVPSLCSILVPSFIFSMSLIFPSRQPDSIPLHTALRCVCSLQSCPPSSCLRLCYCSVQFLLYYYHHDDQVIPSPEGANLLYISSLCLSDCAASSVFLLVPSALLDRTIPDYTITNEGTNLHTPAVPGCVCFFPLPDGIQGTFHQPVSRCSRSREFKRLGSRGVQAKGQPRVKACDLQRVSQWQYSQWQ